MAKGGPADHRRDAPRPQNRGGGGPIPAGPVLPPQRRCPSTTGAAPPQGGHSPAGGSLSEDGERIRAERDRAQPGTVRDPSLIRLAGQRSRVEALYRPDERAPFRGRAANVGPSLRATASLRHERPGEAGRRGGVLRSAIGQPARFCHGAEIPGNFSPRKRAASHRPGAGRDPGRARQGGAPAPYRPHHTLPEDETIRYRVTVCQIRTRLPWTRLTASARCSPGWDFTPRENTKGSGLPPPEITLRFLFPAASLSARAARPPATQRPAARAGRTAGAPRRRSFPRAEPTPARHPDAPRHRHLP